MKDVGERICLKVNCMVLQDFDLYNISAGQNYLLETRKHCQDKI